MPQDNDALIEELVAALHPVRPMRFTWGLTLVVAAAFATLVLVAATLGVRADLLAGHFQPLWLFANGLFLLLGLAAAATVVTMARPQVGQPLEGWKWVAAATFLLPLTTVILLASRNLPVPRQWVSASDFDCVALGLGLGLFTAVALIAWLRRGAPVSTARAGMLIGVASGSIGILAFALKCPSDSLYHVGIWHSSSVVIGGVLGRIAIPKVVAW